MKSKEFLDKWKLFIEENHLKGSVSSKILERYKSNKKWTRYIVGSPKRKENDSNLGKFICVHEPTLQYRKEEFKLDLVFSENNANENLIKIKSGKPLNMEGTFYPNVYDIILEHENYSNKSWEEMFKLTRFRANLKVLITYLEFNVDGKKQMEALTKNFIEIVKNSHQGFQTKEEYVLITGERINNDNGDSIRWNFASIQTDGTNKIGVF
jgi:hypothetical protein